MSNTQPARGMRDFLPADIRKRNYVIGIIKEVYEKYGFEPLETPSVENLETLTGKYGEEGSGLMFKILKRGEKLQQELAEGKIKSENELSDLALRYDLTVPLARVVANYKNDLPKFFKRYQIQPVWRADRPAKGRYREFYQCDVDAIGSSSMIVEAELISAVSEIFEKLDFKDFTIWINHRKLLSGVLESADVLADKNSDVLVSLDKLDKIGEDGVETELVNKGISEESIAALLSFIREVKRTHGIFDGVKASKGEEYSNQQLNKTFNDTTLEMMKVDVLKNSGIGMEGIDDLEETFQLLYKIGIATTKVNPTLARGLSYYTGAILEINVPDFAGSLAGGGRYDGLIGMFGKEQIPAVGFSIGLERILYVMEERGMFPENLTTNSADVMITLWNEETASESLKLAGELRAEGLRVLVYPEADKLGKQFKYADSINIPFVCILGETELAENKVALKNLKTGEQSTVKREEIKSLIVKE
ncbi:MAG: histidine--tRNA ligase [Pyrinomonadaceae bacterium]